MDKYLTVTQINSYIKSLISRDPMMSNIWLVGEISNYKMHISGHSYFTLKDNTSLIKCVMFKSKSIRLKFNPIDGMKVLAYGSISVYEKDGTYQFYVEQMDQFGKGALYIAYEQLKEKLLKEGLFDENRKKGLPMLPKCIGVITSSTGSVIKDIINVTYRRFPGMKIVLFPVNVQGETASRQIANAFLLAEKTRKCDVIILARGGGSIEELWAFNEEITVRAIYECNIPVISAVGHETDFTLSDFVADMRAPTPSAAAEIAVPEYRLLKYTMNDYLKKIQNIPLANIRIKQKELDRIKNSAIFMRPYDGINREMLTLSTKADRLAQLASVIFDRNANKIKILNGMISQLDPLKVLERGYSVAKRKDGKIIDSITDINEGDIFSLVVKDGEFNAEKV